MGKLDLACRRGHVRTEKNTYERPDGKRECLDCRDARIRKQTPDQRARHRRTARSGQLRRRYGITLDDYETMLSAQDGCCAICRNRPRKRKLVVDHDHKKSGPEANRGLICLRCNRGLGNLKDNYKTVSSASGYLARYVWKRMLLGDDPGLLGVR